MRQPDRAVRRQPRQIGLRAALRDETVARLRRLQPRRAPAGRGKRAGGLQHPEVRDDGRERPPRNRHLEQRHLLERLFKPQRPQGRCRAGHQQRAGHQRLQPRIVQEIGAEVERADRHPPDVRPPREPDMRQLPGQPDDAFRQRTGTGQAKRRALPRRDGNQVPRQLARIGVPHHRIEPHPVLRRQQRRARRALPRPFGQVDHQRAAVADADHPPDHRLLRAEERRVPPVRPCAKRRRFPEALIKPRPRLVPDPGVFPQMPDQRRQGGRAAQHDEGLPRPQEQRRVGGGEHLLDQPVAVLDPDDPGRDLSHLLEGLALEQAGVFKPRHRQPLRQRVDLGPVQDGVGRAVLTRDRPEDHVAQIVGNRLWRDDPELHVQRVDRIAAHQFRRGRRSRGRRAHLRKGTGIFKTVHADTGKSLQPEQGHDTRIPLRYKRLDPPVAGPRACSCAYERVRTQPLV